MKEAPVKKFFFNN